LSLGTLDQFFPPSEVKPKQDLGVFVEERCANPKCRKVLRVTDIKYTLRIKGKEAVYCQPCAKQILRPQESAEDNL
jgi:hypothetical protein